jgi:hypothetical protein
MSAIFRTCEIPGLPTKVILRRVFARLGWPNDLEDLRYVGTVVPTKEDADALAACRSIGPWTRASSDAEGEWRWRNDRDGYQEEVERSHRARDERRSVERGGRLRALTLETLLASQPFSRWAEHPPFPPPEFATAANERVLAAIREVRALGPSPKKAKVRATLKALVEWFNAKDAEFGEVIETEEREDIYRVLQDLVTWRATRRSRMKSITGAFGKLVTSGRKPQRSAFC